MTPLLARLAFLPVALLLAAATSAQVMPAPTWVTYLDTGSVTHPDELPAWRGIEVLATGHVVVGGHRSNAAATPWLGEGCVTCFDPTATGPLQLVWSTAIGGTGLTEVTGLCALPNGDVLVSGITNCPTLPTTSASPQPTIGGGFDAFVAWLNGATGAIVCCTYLGGSNGERGIDVAVQSNGGIVVAAYSDSPTWFGTPPCPSYQLSPGGGFDALLVVYDPGLTMIVAATWFGSGGNDFASCLTLDGDRPVLGGTTTAGVATTVGAYRPAFLGTEDGFVARFDPCLSTLQYATHLGGAGRDLLQAVEVAPGGQYVAGGWTPIFDGAGGLWPANGLWDAFLVRLDPTLTGNAQETWLTLVGGSGADGLWDLAVDSAGLVTAVGAAGGPGLPTTAGCYQPSFTPGYNDAFVGRFDPDRRTAAAGNGERIYLSYFGGPGNDNALGVALDAEGDAVFFGHTSGGMNGKTTAGCYQPTFVGPTWDLFIADLPLLPLGITRASGAPACPEAIIAGANSRPFAGNADFTLFASGAPLGSLGVLAIGLPAPTPISTNGVCLLVGPAFGTVLFPNVSQSLVTLPVPIPIALTPPFGITTQWGSFNPTNGLFAASAALIL